LNELEHAFKFNDAVLRHLTISMKHAVTEPSPMMRAGEEKPRDSRDSRPAAPTAAEAATEATGATVEAAS